MADWVPPDRYEGRLILPDEPAGSAAPPARALRGPFDRIVACIERLYEREGKLTRELLEAPRSASVEDLMRLFRP